MAMLCYLRLGYDDCGFDTGCQKQAPKSFQLDSHRVDHFIGAIFRKSVLFFIQQANQKPPRAAASLTFGSS